MPEDIRVLVVDADRPSAEATAETVARAADVSATVAADPDEIVATLGEEPPDCLLCEYDLGPTDGLALLERVRRRSPDLPFLLYTDAGDEAIASEAIGAGVTDYLRRGPDDGRLVERIRAAVEGFRAECDLKQTRSRYRSLVEQNLVGIYVVRDRRFEYVNPRFAEMFGYDVDEVRGAPVAKLVPEDERERVFENIQRRTEGEVQSMQYSFTAVRKDGERMEVEVHGSRVDDDGEPVVMGTLLDRTRERRRSRTLSALYRTTEELTRASDRAEICEIAVGGAEEVLGLVVNSIHLDEGDDRLVPVASTATAVEFFDGLPTFSRSDELVWRAYTDGGFTVEHEGGFSFAADAESVAVAPLGDHGVFVATSPSRHAFDGDSLELLKLLAANAAAALDRAVHETRVSQLHAASRRLMSSRSAEEVASVATETARDVLGLSVSAVFFLADDSLEPAAWTDDAEALLGSLPTFSPDESLAWTAFETGDLQAFDDVRNAENVHNPDTRMRSELVCPLGDHGVFIAGSTEIGAFDDGLVSLAKVFSANVEAALDRADREQRLREREAEYRRQSERLGEFASVVSHDLRNPLGVAQGHLDIAREECESAHLDPIADAHDRMRTLIQDLLTLARQGQAVGETETVDLRLLVTEAWSAAPGGTLDAPDDLGTVECDRDRVRELLVNLFSNAVDHGGEEVTVTVGRLDPDGADADGFFVADDGPGIPPEKRESVFERGVTQREEGTGFGLAIVRSIAEAHGWTVEATESDAGGARMQIRF